MTGIPIRTPEKRTQGKVSDHGAETGVMQYKLGMTRMLSHIQKLR